MDAAFIPFGIKSYSYQNENAGIGPNSFQWLDARKEKVDRYPVCFYTDTFIPRSNEQDADIKIALTIEPYPFRDCIPWLAGGGDENYNYVLSYQSDYITTSDKWLYYPMCASWISRDKWGIKPKSKLCSMIVSHKVEATGHIFRHKIADRIIENGLTNKIDIMGSGYGPFFKNKSEGISDYAFTIIVENECLDGYFAEQLIDAMVMGTVPIYSGGRDPESFFDANGIIRFENIAELLDIINQIDINIYNNRMDAIINNLSRAQEFACLEDWIYKQYPFLFEGL